MTSTEPSDVLDTSRLLQLPREIRDLIYEHALTGTNNIIAIESTVCNTYHATRNQDSSFYSRLDIKHQCDRPRVHRRVWSVPTFDLNVAFGTQDVYNIPKHISMTYQLGLKYHLFDRPNLNLLLANKQIYAEASEIMYGTAMFSFKGDFALAIAFAFLCDRTPSTLRMIRRIELSLLEDSNMSGTTASHYPIMLRSTDSAVLQYAYNHYTDLCTLLSSPRVCLRQLSLRVNSPSTSRRKPNSPKSPEEWLSWEQKEAETLRPYQPVWIEPLLQVQNLDSIRVYWGCNRLRGRRFADTISVLRQNMLKKTAAVSREGEFPAAETPFTFRLLDLGCKADSDTYVNVLAKQFSLQVDGTWELLKHYDESYTRAFYNRHLVSDARTQEGYICYHEAKVK